MSASLRTPTFVPFSGYLLNKYSRVLNQDLIKLHREHGGVPIPVTPETYNICLDMSRRLQPFEPFDPFIKLETNRFIKDLYTAIGSEPHRSPFRSDLGSDCYGGFYS